MNRDKLIKSNISLGLIFKVLSLSTIYVTVPYLMELLGKANYGIWVTIFSVINILFFLDGGITNGLRNKLTFSLSKGDENAAKTYISSAYFTMTTIAFSFFIIGLVLIFNGNLTSFLEIESVVSEKQIKWVFLIVLISIVFNFVLSLYKALFFAIQKSRIVELSMFIYQVVILIFVILGIYFFDGTLVYVALIYGITSLIIGVSFTSYFFLSSPLRIKSKYYDFEKVKELLSLGIEFFIIQISMIVIFTTDNILTIKLLGPEEVSNYDTHYKLYQLLVTFSIIFLEPYWSMFSDAYQKKDFKWIKASIRKLNWYFLSLIILVFILTLSSEKLISLWMGTKIDYSWVLSICFGFFVLIRVYGVIYMYFLNGIGKIRIQMWLFLFGAILNIPLSIYLVKSFHIGSAGIILGTIGSILALTIFLPIQSTRIIKKNEVN